MMTLALSPIQPDPPPTAELRREGLGYLGMILARTPGQTAETVSVVLAEAAIERLADLAGRLDAAAKALPSFALNRGRFVARASMIADACRRADPEGVGEASA